MWLVATVLNRAEDLCSQVDPTTGIFCSNKVNLHFLKLNHLGLWDRGPGDGDRIQSFPVLHVGLLIVYMIAFLKGLHL